MNVIAYCRMKFCNSIYNYLEGVTYMYNNYATKVIYFTIIFSILVVFICFLILFLQKRTVKEGTVTGKCIDKFTGQTGSSSGYVNNGNGYSSGSLKTDFYITLELKNGSRKTYRCKDLTFGKVVIGESVKINYKVLGNGQKWIKSLQIKK